MRSSNTAGFFVTGIALIVTAILLGLRKIKWMAKTKTAGGTIVRSELITDDEGGKAWHPVIEFAAETAERVEFRSTIGTASDKWKPGDPVPGRYNPSKPTKAVIDRIFYIFLVPIVLSFLGVIFAGIALYIDFSGAS